MREGVLTPMALRLTSAPKAFTRPSSIATRASRAAGATHRISYQQFANMSTTDPASSSGATAGGRKYEWLVVVPDFPGALQKRLEIRPEHFAGVPKWRDSGLWKMGGAILEDVPKDDDASSMKFVGSTLIAVAETREEVVEMLKSDIYYKKGVWDVEKAQIWAHKSAFRNP